MNQNIFTTLSLKKGSALRVVEIPKYFTLEFRTIKLGDVVIVNSVLDTFNVLLEGDPNHVYNILYFDLYEPPVNTIFFDVL